MEKKTKKAKTTRQLRTERDDLWRQWQGLQKKSSFSGLHISAELSRVQEELEERERVPSKRYYTELSIEIG